MWIASNPSGSSTSSVAVLTILPTTPPTTATLTDVQVAGNDWNSASDWDIGISALQLSLQSPGSTNIVPAGNCVLNTPDIGKLDIAFPGARLIIQGGHGNFINNNGDANVGGSSTSELRASEPNSVTIYFPDLQMAGGQLDNSGNNVGNGNAGQSLGMLTINGEMDILGNTTIYSDSGVRGGSLRAIQIGAWLTGSGTVSYSSFDTAFANDLNLTGGTNTFNGQWDVLRGALLGSGLNSLGTNAITVETAGALETAYNINDPAASLTLNGEMFLHQNDTFQTVTVERGYAVAGGHVCGGAIRRRRFRRTSPATSGRCRLVRPSRMISGSLTVLSGPPGPQAAKIGSIVVQGTSLTLTGSNGTPTGIDSRYWLRPC